MPEDAHRHTCVHIHTYTCARAQLASDGSSYVPVRVHIWMHMCVCVCVYSCAMSPNVSARVSSVRREKETEEPRVWGGRWKEREDEGEFVRVETRRVFIRRDGEWRKEGGRERVKLMYLFCGHPHMLSWAREDSAALARKSHGEADGRDDVARLHVEYQPSVIAFVCKGRLFPPLPSLSSITTHRYPHHSFALVVSSRRVCAPISRLSTCRCDSTRIAC